MFSGPHGFVFFCYFHLVSVRCTVYIELLVLTCANTNVSFPFCLKLHPHLGFLTPELQFYLFASLQSSDGL